MPNVTLIIGSNAMRKRGFVVDRESFDIDLIARPADAVEYIGRVADPKDGYKISTTPDHSHLFAFPENPRQRDIIEIELAWPGTTGLALLELIEGQGRTGVQVATAGELFALKTSHKYKKNSRHFQKTRKDIITLKSAGVKLPKYLKEWWKDRVRETYNYKHPRLAGVSKADFFNDDGIQYVYDHDAIHMVVKNLDKPAYRFFQPDGEEVHTSKEEFHAQPRYVKL